MILGQKGFRKRKGDAKDRASIFDSSREKPLLEAVSGATMTSKGYLIAVADALRRRESSP
ncbi:FMN-binding protein [Alkalispirochaeta alkalica]|uniref:FMN-binding protein n=1 Tax=Alkalispirochaeta alkalica TaxID=46356 RepID=UPI0012FE1DD9